MKCIVGLGNPGHRYRTTRHNVGFQSVEYLLDRFAASYGESTEQYESYTASVDGIECWLVMPQTYMNNSGFAVREWKERREIAADDMLIIYDDFQLPFGTLRMRPKGSDGGHNGLASVIGQLQSEMIPRLRIGVAGMTVPEHHTHELMAGYVLSPFAADEMKLLPELYRHTGDACVSWITSGIQKTMNQFNRNFFHSADAG